MSTIDTTNIDSTKPIEGSPTTQSVRDNFSEIIAQLDNADTSINLAAKGYANIAALRAITVAPDEVRATTDGYYTDNDGGQGSWLWDSTSTATDNGGTIIKATAITTGRWLRLYSGIADPVWFGAKFDGTTDDSAALSATATANTFTIPTDFPDLQVAMNNLGSRSNKQDSDVILTVETGHALTSGFRVENGDYSYITINSVDATVNVSAGMTMVSNADLDAAVPRTAALGFLAVNAKMPKWDFLCDVSAQTSMVTAYELDHGSVGIVTPVSGIKNCAVTNVRISTDSRFHAYQSDFRGGDVNVSVTISAIASVPECIMSGAGTTGLDVSRGSMVYANQADLTGSSGNGVYVRRSWLSADAADFTNSVQAIWATIGSRVEATDGVFTGCTTDVKCENGSLVDVSGGLRTATILDAANMTLSDFNRVTPEGLVTNNDHPSGSVDYLTATSPTITQDIGSGVSVATVSYTTALTLTGEYTVHGGSIYGADVGVKITIDGTVVLNDGNRAIGQDGGANDMSVAIIPPCKCKVSILIEAYNRAGTTKLLGWKIHRS